MSVAESNTRRKLERIENDPINLEPTPQNLYMWGWLWSDGYIGKCSRGQPRISLEIVTDDFEDIATLFPSQFSRYDRQRKGRRPQSSAVCTREDYYDFLISNGYDHKQNPSQLMIRSDMSNHWFRGVIDGDGSWYFNEKWKTRQFILASHHEQDWSWFTNQLEELGCSYKVTRRSTKTGNYSIVRTTKKSCLRKLQEYLYPNGYEFGLVRKYEKSKLIL